MDPELTASKNYPFLHLRANLFSHTQLGPLQDGPCIRFTYDATVEVPGNDGCHECKESNWETKFWDLPIQNGYPHPAYLMALAAEILHSNR